MRKYVTDLRTALRVLRVMLLMEELSWSSCVKAGIGPKCKLVEAELKLKDLSFIAGIRQNRN